MNYGLLCTVDNIMKYLHCNVWTAAGGEDTRSIEYRKKKQKNISIVKYCRPLRGRPRLGRLSSTSTVVIHSKLVYKLTLSWLIDLLYFDWCLVHSNHWALLFTQTFSTLHVRTVHTRRKRSRIKKRNNIWSIVFFVVIITSSRWSRTKPLRKCFWWEYNQRRIYVFVYVYA